MVLSENLAANSTSETTNLALIHITQRMQILVQQRIIHIGVELSPFLRQVRNLLEQDPVHHDEVRTHLMKRPNIFRKIRQAKQQACPPLSKTSLDRLLNQLKNLGEIETPVEVFRNLHFSRITFGAMLASTRFDCPGGYLRTGFP